MFTEPPEYQVPLVTYQSIVTTGQGNKHRIHLSHCLAPRLFQLYISNAAYLAMPICVSSPSKVLFSVMSHHGSTEISGHLAAAEAAFKQFALESWVLTSVAILICALRTYTRVRVVGMKNLCVDDYMVWVGVVSLCQVWYYR